MITSVLFFFTRLVQLVTTIPIWGLLAYFVSKYDKANQTPPAEILVLFIVAIIATVWALFTLIQSKRFGVLTLLTALVDLAITGGFIAGIYLLRGVRNADCVGGSAPISISFGDNTASAGNSWGVRVSKHCAMFKASWALAILNCILFFFTALFAAHIYKRGGDRVVHEKHAHGTHGTSRRRRRYY